MTARRASLAFAGALALLAVVAWLSPAPDRVTDRGVYEATAASGIVPDCSDLHCFRVLVPWVLGPLPGPSDVKWKAYAVAANAAGAAAVLQLALALGLTVRGAWLAAALSAVGFGSLYTLHDPFTSDPLMYFLGPLVTLEVMRHRVAVAGAAAMAGALAKEFVVAALAIGAMAEWLAGRRLNALHAVAATGAAFIVWMTLQLTLQIGFNYSYGDNASTHLLSGGYLVPWLQQQSARGVLSALVNEFGVLYLLAPAGLLWASAGLRRLALLAIPVAALFGYVQQPDRALWNFHYLATPLAACVLERVQAPLAWITVAAFAVANLRVGAQLAFVPDARFALGASVVLGVAAVALALRREPSQPPMREGLA